MMGRLVHTADFRRLLDAPPRCRSAHFALHHVAEAPGAQAAAARASRTCELSTSAEQSGTVSVDNLAAVTIGRWLGLVVPKRHARRAVTRNQIKRTARGVAAQHEGSLPEGMWLLRLRHGYGGAQFSSAWSDALASVVLQELDHLFRRAVR